MNGINKDNYEAFLLDSIEGRLSAEQQLDLDAFMAMHPDLTVDLEDFADVTFDPQQTIFGDKSALKKTESDLIPAEHFIAYIEQQLGDEEKQAFEKSCTANPSLAKELEQYQNTIAVADSSVVFEDKESLKRQPKIILFNFRAASFAAAASVAFLLMLYVLWPAKTADAMLGTYAHAGQRKANSTKAQFSGTTTTNDSTNHSTQQDSFVTHTPQPETLLAHHNSANATNTATTAYVTAPDTSSRIASVKNQELPKKEPVLIASVSPKTVVEVITEHDEEVMETNTKKQGFWAVAGKTLKNLNKAGVKSVNGKEETTKENASYALTLGGMSITHKAH